MISDIDLERLYVAEQKSCFEISEESGGINVSTLYKRMEKLGIPRRSKSQAMKLAYQKNRQKVHLPPTGKGSNSPSWKGGRWKTAKGYSVIYCPGHHHAHCRGKYVLEHILIWEKAHDQQLPKGWVVHHLNGIKDDNRPENLAAMPRKKHHNFLFILELQNRILDLEQKGITPILLERTPENIKNHKDAKAKGDRLEKYLREEDED